MDIFSLGLLIGLLIALAMGLWVGFSLILISLIALFLNDNQAIEMVFASSAWGHLANWPLTSLPLFILMGEVLFQTQLAKGLFNGLSPWLVRVPGKLYHVNILGSGLFAAVSGSSAATAATVGRMTLSELKQRGYREHISLGSLAGSATLGLLIPPSIILIVYGVATELSIAKLFVAGIVPGLTLMLLFMCLVALQSRWAASKDLAHHTDTQEPESFNLKTAVSSLPHLLPVLGLISFVIGSIYSGLITPTESAAIGALGAMIIAAIKGQLDKDKLKRSLLGTVKTSCMILFILLGAHFLAMAMGFLQIPADLALWVSSLGLSQVELLIGLTILFIILGLFLDGISVVVLTTSILMPIVEQAGFDPFWFAIYLVVVVEMSQITPPVGFNLFVLQSLTGKGLFTLARAALPYFLTMCLFLILLYLVPALVIS